MGYLSFAIYVVEGFSGTIGCIYLLTQRENFEPIKFVKIALGFHLLAIILMIPVAILDGAYPCIFYSAFPIMLVATAMYGITDALSYASGMYMVLELFGDYPKDLGRFRAISYTVATLGFGLSYLASHYTLELMTI